MVKKCTEDFESDIVLYGFGRIGRLLARELIAKSGSKEAIRLRAIVIRKNGENDLMKRASLLRRDSVHGSFDGTITVDHDSNAIIANGQRIQVIYASSPSEVDYTAYDIDNALVVDNTGKWRDREGLSQHLQSKGASRVLLTAPGKDDRRPSLCLARCTVMVMCTSAACVEPMAGLRWHG